ncbi:hypothetical protein BJV74DRAFT_865424, partial [Russula compacta]
MPCACLSFFFLPLFVFRFRTNVLCSTFTQVCESRPEATYPFHPFPPLPHRHARLVSTAILASRPPPPSPSTLPPQPPAQDSRERITIRPAFKTFFFPLQALAVSSLSTTVGPTTTGARYQRTNCIISRHNDPDILPLVPLLLGNDDRCSRIRL